jgi:uncharacterized protein YdaU (DUF1376 family)
LNYYPFHIGDYASATRHLSWDEDAAYRRLLDVYYTHEKAIPVDKVYRLVVATSRQQKQAVDTVLQDFFTSTPDGWMHERCEMELDSMRIKQSAQEEKDRHETDRMRRYRERRAMMFAALRVVDIVPAWDVPMKELQRLFDTHCNAPATPSATHLQREQAVADVTPATAIPTPTPTPTPSIKERESSAKAPRPAKKCPDDFSVTQEMQDWATEHKVTVDLKTETEKFKDYTFTRTISDWLGAWRNWIRKAQEFSEKAQKPQGFTPQNSNKYAAAGRAIFEDEFAVNPTKHMGEVINV